MSAFIILIAVAGIAAAVVVFNKKKQQSPPVTPAVAQDPNVPVVETPSNPSLVAEEPIATPEQKATRKANAAKQAAKQASAKQPVSLASKKITKREL